MRRFLTIVSTALITAGIVALADVGVTLAWEEPVSSIYATIQQQRAEGELDDLEASFLEDHPPPDVQDLGNPRAARRLANEFEPEIVTGQAIGRIEVPAIDVDVVVVQGTDEATLQKGPGHYPDTGLPGQGMTMGIAGHRTTYLAPFRNITELQSGDEVILRMPYAEFTYEVEKTEIVEPTEVDIVRDVGHERVVLTACHPLYSAAERYAVFGRLTEIELTQG